MAEEEVDWEVDDEWRRGHVEGAAGDDDVLSLDGLGEDADTEGSEYISSLQFLSHLLPTTLSIAATDISVARATKERSPVKPATRAPPTGPSRGQPPTGPRRSLARTKGSALDETSPTSSMTIRPAGMESADRRQGDSKQVLAANGSARRGNEGQGESAAKASRASSSIIDNFDVSR